MDASTRLYAKLGEITENPDASESLDDLIVCAFGAFERYYLCWKTKDGNFRQDGYDLPLALNEWLNPTDGTTRDWASLQVVFGRGEEYFASDKNGKLEFKEREVRKLVGEEERERIDRQALRRSRTVSFLRPLSHASNRSDVPVSDAPLLNKRTSSISSRRVSRSPSLSYSTTSSETSLVYPDEPKHPDLTSMAPLSSTISSTATPKGAVMAPSTNFVHLESLWTVPSTPTTSITLTTRDLAPISSQLEPSTQDLNQSVITTIPEERIGSSSVYKSTSETCNCDCHIPPLSYVKRSTYANASVQTDPISPLSRTSLRVDTFSTTSWRKNNHAVSQDTLTPVFDVDGLCLAPFSIGRMSNYFSKPGYQLGDSLSGSYCYPEQPVYQYQEEFGKEALRQSESRTAAWAVGETTPT